MAVGATLTSPNASIAPSAASDALARVISNEGPSALDEKRSAELDARLDFDDERDPLDEADVARRIDALAEDVREVLRTARMGALMDAGATVAIVGVPNAGKSSLLNAWSASERAIVADERGQAAATRGPDALCPRGS